KIGEISDISKCFENFVSQALGVLTRIYAAELRKYVSKIYKSGQPHQNVNNLIINTCRFCINRDKWGGYKDEKFQQFTISPLKNA
ncbi:MAG: hypothetical protein E7L36_06885, partial [Prevotella bivia]|nr:hypothetical protein [Prevotella bivia]